MSSTSSRTLQLLSLLQNHRYWPGAELADRLDVSVRTLRRDIDRLRELGYPVDAQRGVDGGYQLAAGAALPPLLLDDDEAVALAVGLQTAVQSGTIAGIAESSARALTKVVQVMPPRLRPRVDALCSMTVPALWSGTAAGVDPRIVTLIAQLCRDNEGLGFIYTAAGGERTTRTVEPHRLVLLGRRWYLVAYDVDRHDWRSFRLDRLGEPYGSGARFHPRRLPTEDAAEFVRGGIDNLPASHHVEVLVHAPAAVVTDRIGRWGTVEDLGEGQCVLRMTSDSLDWPAMALGAVGAEFEVISPPELLSYIRDWAERFNRAAARGTTTAFRPREAGITRRSPQSSGITSRATNP
jgi:predicted DNA-binding transcriptional regulator YafY